MTEKCALLINIYLYQKYTLWNKLFREYNFIMTKSNTGESFKELKILVLETKSKNIKYYWQIKLFSLLLSILVLKFVDWCVCLCRFSWFIILAGKLLLDGPFFL